MKYFFLPLLLLACSPNVWPADSDGHDWVLEQYANKSPEITQIAKGKIDGEEYIVIMANRTSPDSESGPVTLMFKKTPDRPAFVAQLDFPYNADHDVYIKNNSIYIKYGTAHNGVYNKRYQFKQIEHKFRMVGIESQSIAMLCSIHDDQDCDDAWFGTSYNLLASSAICWKTTSTSFEDCGHDKKCEARMDKKFEERKRKFENFLYPKNRVSHRMRFRPVKKLPLLDEFDFYSFETPAACYFDHENKLQFDRPAP